MPGAPDSQLLALGNRKEKLFHVLEQELLSLGLPEVEPVVIDELLLGLEPLCPADGANLFIRATAQVVLEGLKRHPISIQTATGAVKGGHRGKIDTQ
jgi:hypothetical protein